MFAVASRSGLMVKLETPTSYLPEPTPAMIESNGAVSNLASSPSFSATRVNRSTSKPTIVEPSSPMNSAGAYVVSLPTAITPSDAIAPGTPAARAWSAVTLGSGDDVLPLAPAAPPLESDELSPQPLSASAVLV